MNTYVVGQTFRLYCDFYSLAGVLTDPTGVALSLQSPSLVTVQKTLAAAEVVKESTGVFYFELAASEPGRWDYRWEGTGTVKAVDESSYLVEASRL